ncbi:hypothetical protein MVEN_01498800 [Mycena venus]|uniref:Uncharacterized protein n=1 Tax=Mycena venus TaxID=2733690 RepID=A0A8H6XVD5_9AGAR|nr:hypothetical protein MVEN_01498800 [Mycena venus]
MDTDVDSPSAVVSGRVSWGETNWSWDDEYRWESAPPLWQRFMAYWMNPEHADIFNKNEFPYVLPIFPSSEFPTPSHCMHRLGATPLLDTDDGKILVLERYALLYEGLDRKRSDSYRGGVIIGGQPGEKSVFLWYTVVRLISDGQPVCLYLPQKETSCPAILFFRGQAWCPNGKFDFMDLPYGDLHTQQKRHKPIFVLVDSAAKEEPSGFNLTMGWPVYAVSPKPGKSREFRHHRHPTIWGLNLWTPEDLRRGLEVHSQWTTFYGGLVSLLEGKEPEWFPENLQKAKQLLLESKYAEWERNTVENWISIILDDTIHWRGLIPRHVFQHILDTDTIIAPPIPSDPLDKIIQYLANGSFAVYGSADPLSHEIIALRTDPASLTSLQSSRFDFVIRSEAVNQLVSERMLHNKTTQIAKVFEDLRLLQDGALLADHALGPQSHLLYSAISPVSTSTSPLYMPTQYKSRQPWYEWDYKNGTPNSLYQRRRAIFVPVATNAPLFDAFTLHASDPHLRTLWIMQFTTRRHHKGDGGGYPKVRKLMTLAGHKQKARWKNDRCYCPMGSRYPNFVGRTS